MDKIIDNSEHMHFTYVHKVTGDMINWPVPVDKDEYYEVPFTEESKRGESWDDDIKQWVSDSVKQSELAVNRRVIAYRNESDRLFIEWQYDEAIGSANADLAKQAWIDKVAEIKLMYPKG